jgi:DNA-binding LacI/PurR family transcriptional regulator
MLTQRVCLGGFVAVTSSDVARRAGVSQATVSYVLNKTRGQAISPATQSRVLRAAAELGYQLNPVARGLRKGRTEAVVAPLPGLTLTYPLARLVECCSVALEGEGLFLVPDFTPRATPADQVAAWRRLAPTAVLDVLLRHDDPLLAEVRAAGIPVLSANVPQDPGWESTGDVFSRSQRVTQVDYLIGRGHRRIAAIVPRHLGIDRRAERKLYTVMRTTARERGGQLDVQRVDLTPASLRLVAQRWIQEQTLPDAVAAYNDDYAVAMIGALHAQGMRVPDDIAVMGLDDMPLGRVFTPALTTITADFEDFARAVAQAVRALADGVADVAPLPVPRHSVVPRESA